MKKVWILLIILLCPLVIKAENITNYYINATLNSNGDLLVEEYIELKENTNYFERNIYYKDNTLKVPAYDNFIEYNKLNNGNSIQFLTIGSIPKVKNNTEEITGVKEFSKTNVAHTGDTNIYIAIKDNSAPLSDTTSWRVLTIKGLQGLSGEGLTFAGAWNSTTAYNTNDVVTYQNELWSATQPNTNQEPSDTSEYWQNYGNFPVTTIVVSQSQPSAQSVGDFWFQVVT